MTPETGTPRIHPTAIIDPRAELDPTVTVGPYSIIEGPARIGPGTALLAHCFLSGHVTIGAENRIGPYACIGTDPQSIGRFPEDTGVVIGDRNVIREFSQIHRSITADVPTRVGDDNFIMSGGHVAHDCVVGNHCILTNGAFISGHCVIGDRVNISSPVGIHQFTRIGRLAFISAGSAVGMDVPPFMIVEGRNTVRALNVVGMKRSGIGPEARKEIKRVYKALYLSARTITRAISMMDVDALCPEAREIIDFCLAPGRRGIMPHAPHDWALHHHSEQGGA